MVLKFCDFFGVFFQDPQKKNNIPAKKYSAKIYSAFEILNILFIVQMCYVVIVAFTVKDSFNTAFGSWVSGGYAITIIISMVMSA